MGMKAMELKLDANGVDYATEAAFDFLKRVGMDDRNARAGTLSFEIALLRLRDELGDGADAKITESKLFARPRFSVAVRGKRFDPVASSGGDGAYAVMSQSLLESSGLKPNYLYLGGSNIIILSHVHSMGTLARIVTAFVLGIVVSVIGMQVIPEADRTFLLDTFVNPIGNLFLGMLGGVAGPLVFLTVAWGVCSVSDGAALGRSGAALIVRHVRDNSFSVVLAVLVGYFAFHLPSGTESGPSTILSDVMALFIDLFPTNCFAPFVEGNTFQIILLGLFVGIAALMLGDSCVRVRAAICELNSLVQFLMEQLCRFLPAFIFVMVCTQVWSGTFMLLFSSWLPLLLIASLSVMFFAFRLACSSARYHMPFGELFGAMRAAIMVALTTASSTAAFGHMVTACRENLHVGEEQVSLGLPLGMVLSQSSTVIKITIMMMFSMHLYGLSADVMWYVRLTLLAFLYSVVAPPVPGGMIVCYGLIMAALNVPAEALTIVAALDIIIDYVGTATRVGFMMLEVYDVGCSLGAIEGA